MKCVSRQKEEDIENLGDMEQLCVWKGEKQGGGNYYFFKFRLYLFRAVFVSQQN